MATNTSSLQNDGIGEFADVLNRDGPGVPGAQPTGLRFCGHVHAFGRAGEDDRDGDEGRAAAQGSMVAGTLKIMSEVRECCTRSPFSVVEMASALGSGISSVVTNRGPSGAKVSKKISPAPLSAA